jgi:hypothetical protein
MSSIVLTGNEPRPTRAGGRASALCMPLRPRGTAAVPRGQSVGQVGSSTRRGSLAIVPDVAAFTLPRVVLIHVRSGSSTTPLAIRFAPPGGLARISSGRCPVSGRMAWLRTKVFGSTTDALQHLGKFHDRAPGRQRQQLQGRTPHGRPLHGQHGRCRALRRDRPGGCAPRSGSGDHAPRPFRRPCRWRAHPRHRHPGGSDSATAAQAAVEQLKACRRPIGAFHNRTSWAVATAPRRRRTSSPTAPLTANASAKATPCGCSARPLRLRAGRQRDQPHTMQAQRPIAREPIGVARERISNQIHRRADSRPPRRGCIQARRAQGSPARLANRTRRASAHAHRLAMGPDSTAQAGGFVTRASGMQRYRHDMPGDSTRQ